jgi:hypothetical protein
VKVYRILDTKTGLFSKGSSYANVSLRRWSKRGKVWNSIGSLKNHLNLYKKIPEHWTVVEYEIEEVEASRYPVAYLVDGSRLVP